jgi:hypothetical protein
MAAYFVGTATVDLTQGDVAAFYAWSLTCAILVVTGTLPLPVTAVPLYFIAQNPMPPGVVATGVSYTATES